MEQLGPYQHYFSFTWYIQGVLVVIVVLLLKLEFSSNVFQLIFRLLVFAQNRSNHALAILMATSFFLQIVLGFSIACLAHYLSGKTYWWSTSHPLSRLPVFFMGICAGVLCVRIQNGDLDALNRKNCFCFFKLPNRYVNTKSYLQNLVERVKIGSYHM